jgi:hypothetical protein
MHSPGPVGVHDHGVRAVEQISHDRPCACNVCHLKQIAVRVQGHDADLMRQRETVGNHERGVTGDSIGVEELERQRPAI